jgi:hypothetical protein
MRGTVGLFASTQTVRNLRCVLRKLVRGRRRHHNRTRRTHRRRMSSAAAASTTSPSSAASTATNNVQTILLAELELSQSDVDDVCCAIVHSILFARVIGLYRPLEGHIQSLDISFVHVIIDMTYFLIFSYFSLFRLNLTTNRFVPTLPKRALASPLVFNRTIVTCCVSNSLKLARHPIGFFNKRFVFVYGNSNPQTSHCSSSSARTSLLGTMVYSYSFGFIWHACRCDCGAATLCSASGALPSTSDRRCQQSKTLHSTVCIA